ncbi:hypothetical protein IT568_11560, partial [bacterium]|nr:hypothetical protein [bacterium]
PTLKSASTISPPGADGSGTVTVSPNSVPNSANTTLTFTFSGTVTDTVTQLTLDLPTTWVFDGTSAASSSGTVSATTSQVSVSGTSISAGQNLTLTLSNLTSAANSETSTFNFKTAGTNGTLTAIASQPKVTVFVVDGSGTVTVSPNSVVTSTTTSLTFTLTGTVNATLSKISVDLPTGWVFDGTSAVSSSGTVSATTSQVSVSGASVSFGQTLTVTLSNLVSPSAAGSSVFVCKTAGANGTLTTITGTQPTVAVSLPPGAAIPIAEIRNNFSVYNGQTLTIEAVVTVPFGTLRNDRLDLYVQDDSGFGINVYGASGIALADTAKFKRGNKVKIEGKITEYSGTKEIEVSATSVITLVGTGFPLPAPKVFAAPSLVYAEISKWEGTWLQLVGVVDAVATTPAGGGYTINLHGKPSTELFDTRVWEVSGITPGSIFTVGDTVTVTGIGDFFGTKVQIPIANASDVVKGGTFTEPPPQPVSDGAGSAEAGQIFVSKGFTGSLDITFNGAGPDTAGIGQVSLAVPAEVTFTTFTLSGEGFAGATQTTTGNEIKITGATLSEGKKGVISFANVTFPNEDKILSFVSKSAKTNGTLTATAENPVFIVGIGNSASVAVDSIQKDEEAFNGQTVTVTGIVTFDQGLISTLGETWVQDASGRGINVFSSQINGIKRGTVVTIVGQIENYLSSSAGTSDFKTTELTNLVSVTQHGRVASISSILNEVTLNEVSESSGQNHRFEGTTVKMKVRVTEVPASPVGGGYNVIIVDTLESEITLRVWTSTSINPAEILKVGTTYDMILLVDTYRSDLQMVLGFKNDVKEFIIDTSGYPDFGLRLRYNGVLLHHLSQKFEIEYQVPSSGNTKMRVFDLKGRSVATLLDNFEGGESNVWKNVSWAGTNDAGEPQPMGVYLCHYVFTDYASGKTYKKVIPLVIGTKF